MEIITKNWESIFYDEIQKSKKLRIISPFLSQSATGKIVKKFDCTSFELVTRYNQRDFAFGVSSIPALKKLIQAGTSIYGVTGLHSKVYIFDNKSAFVSSSNLTQGGLKNNHECGVYIEDETKVGELIEYFEELKSTNSAPLTTEECEQWETEIQQRNITIPNGSGLKDLGYSLNDFNSERKYFVKFLGHSDNRVNIDFPTKEEIDRALCHYALGFPEKGKPRKISDDDVIFIARMTKDPNDNMIFGRALAYKFNPNIDMATEEEIENRSWMEHWPSLLKVHDAEFIDGPLSRTISLKTIMNNFGHNTFASTKRNYKKGEGNVTPSKSIMQSAYIQLATESAQWLENEFRSRISSVGTVDEDFIESLPIPENVRVR